MDTDLTMNVPIVYSPDAEEALIGSVIVDHRAFLLVSSFLNSADFFLERHEKIWDTIIDLVAEGDAVDYLTITDRLQANDCLQEIGGAPYITQLINNTPTSVHAETYARLVQRSAIRRQMLALADEIKAMAFDEELSTESALNKMNEGVLSVNMGNSGGRQKSMKQVMSEVFDDIEANMNHSGTIGVTTGFRDIDRLLGGFRKSDLTILAGRPGSGKTAWLMDAAVNAARQGARVAVFSMEMISRQLGMRMVAADTSINLAALRNGHINQAEFSRAIAGTGRLSELPIWFDDRSSLRPAQLRAQLGVWIVEHDIDLVLVDHLQEFGKDNSFRNTYDLRSHDAKAMKDIARDLDVPMVVSCQLSRSLEQRQDKRPVLSDLRDSGVIEEKADVVAFLYREEMYNAEAEFMNLAEFIVSKQRNGPVGTVNLWFDKQHTRFTDAQVRRIDLNEDRS